MTVETVIPAVAQSPYIPRGLEIIFRKLFLIDPSVFKGSRGFSAGAPVKLYLLLNVYFLLDELFLFLTNNSIVTHQLLVVYNLICYLIQYLNWFRFFLLFGRNRATAALIEWMSESDNVGADGERIHNR